MVPCGFNTLVPAFIAAVNLTSLVSVSLASTRQFSAPFLNLVTHPDSQSVIGELDTGTQLNYGQAIGTMKSVDGYPVNLNATAVHTDDLPTADATNFHLSIRGVWQTDDDTLIAYNVEGPLAATQKIVDIFSGAPNATATEWGESYSALFWHFYVKDGPYKDLEDSLFVSSARVFPASSDGKVVASLEYRISKVDPGPLCKD
ncbi:hypothetical protein MMC10_007183 [Thelotrema lepadinum]|nr:hypothetical protein [Thelotrema lepadinum]